MIINVFFVIYYLLPITATAVAAVVKMIAVTAMTAMGTVATMRTMITVAIMTAMGTMTAMTAMTAMGTMTAMGRMGAISQTIIRPYQPGDSQAGGNGRQAVFDNVFFQDPSLFFGKKEADVFFKIV